GETAVAQMREALKQAVCDDGLERIELKLPGFHGEGDGRVVADDFESDLVDDFRNHRIHLPRHDAGASLHRRQVDLAESRTRSAGEQSQVVAGLRQLARHALEYTGQLNESTSALRSFDQVGCGDDCDAGDVTQVATS